MTDKANIYTDKRTDLDDIGTLMYKARLAMEFGYQNQKAIGEGSRKRLSNRKELELFHLSNVTYRRGHAKFIMQAYMMGAFNRQMQESVEAAK